jgi:hypothetical protein
MSTRQTASPAASPWVGEARVVITALGVSVLRLWAWRMTGIGASPTIDNAVVYSRKMVNLVVDRVK